MPDAWTILKGNSSLGSGDAWEHLNNQQGGTGVGLVLHDGLEVALDNSTLLVELDTALTVEVQETEFEILVEQ